ncbi:MAG: alpha/beta hydrolase [Lachnospiraceae bacterium]|nr:alpha/beta hydrolase [Lachnospiraceae bacterium]
MKRDASVTGVVMRQLLTDITGTAAGHKLQNGEYRKHPVEPEWHCPRGFKREMIEREHYVMEYLSPETVQDKRVILQLHGGGYIGPMKNIYRRFSVLYSKALGRGRVLTIDYRVAPEHPFPAALEDAADAYDWLSAHYPAENIIIAGDSAGGGLALALCHYLKDKKKELPAGLILMSPWTDLTCSGESYTENYEKDPLFGRTEDSMLYNKDYIGENDPHNPYISPLFGSFEGFPPMLVQVGSYEMLLSDSLSVEKKVKGAGGKIRCTVYEGMFHVFQMARDMLPESRHAWQEIRDYLDFMKKVIDF